MESSVTRDAWHVARGACVRLGKIDGNEGIPQVFHAGCYRTNVVYRDYVQYIYKQERPIRMLIYGAS